MRNQFELKLIASRWLESLPEEEDRCAHGKVLARIGRTVVSDASKGDWTVSAAALFLLRTLTQDHTPAAPIGDQLLPCCGFTMWPNSTSDDVLVLSCSNGVDWSVEHVPEGVQLTVPEGESVTIPNWEYQKAVLQFADEVCAFYRSSKPKLTPTDADDATGYELFWKEWHRRYQQFNS